jgi:hypothetical protein
MDADPYAKATEYKNDFIYDPEFPEFEHEVSDQGKSEDESIITCESQQGNNGNEDNKYACRGIQYLPAKIGPCDQEADAAQNNQLINITGSITHLNKPQRAVSGQNRENGMIALRH